MDGLPDARRSGFAERMAPRERAISRYLRELDASGRSFTDVLADHGLTMTDIPSADEQRIPGQRPHITVVERPPHAPMSEPPRPEAILPNEPLATSTRWAWSSTTRTRRYHR